MEALYTFSVWLYGRLVRLAARMGHRQAHAWVEGRADLPQRLAVIPANRRLIWFHAASAGEFEQARPLIEHHKRFYPKDFILLSFYSPSGYELRKNYSGADLVCYLPEDQPKQVQAWLNAIKPALAVFVKYEFWYHHFAGLKQRNIPLLLVSAPFRSSQPFFHPLTRSFWGKMLGCVTHFFVQDQRSGQLLASLGYYNYTVCGDTRTDRVLQLAAESWLDPLLESFSRNAQVLVAGSTWPADEILIQKALSDPRLSHIKLVVAPHEVSPKRSAELLHRFDDKAVLYSHATIKEATAARVLVLNTMGILSKVYRQGQFAYIGGGFGKGIHNTLEAAVYGVPICFGPKYQKYLEAQALIAQGLAKEVRKPQDLQLALLTWNDAGLQTQFKNKAARWFKSQSGATTQIAQEMAKLLAG